MNDKVKLIIEINPHIIYAIQNNKGLTLGKQIDICNAIKDGIPLDSVKFHIEHMACKQYEHRLTLDRQGVIDVLDNFIGKESEGRNE